MDSEAQLWQHLDSGCGNDLAEHLPLLTALGKQNSVQQICSRFWHMTWQKIYR